MEQPADRAEAAVIDHYIPSSTENISFVGANGHQETDSWLFCDVPLVS